jgi:hypothetical protein
MPERIMSLQRKAWTILALVAKHEPKELFIANRASAACLKRREGCR